MKLPAILPAPVSLVGCAARRMGAGSIEQCKPQPGVFYEAIHAAEGGFGFEGGGPLQPRRRPNAGPWPRFGPACRPSGRAAVWQQRATGSIVHSAKGMAAPVALLATQASPSSLPSGKEATDTATVSGRQPRHCTLLEAPAGDLPSAHADAAARGGMT